MNIVLVAVGGGLGAVCRYAVSAIAARLSDGAFTWGTAVVNIVGSFLIGVAAGFLERSALSRLLWMFLVTGFLGGFTTFSTFSLEIMQSLKHGSTARAFAGIAVNLAGGLLACAFGLWIVLRVPVLRR